jgi:uracil-DNA glycosylase
VILFVGDKPSPRMKPGAKPFQGAACEKRLRSWIKKLGLKKNQYHIVNQSSLNFIRGQQLEYHHTWIALGEKAADFIRQGNVRFFKLPHPSGRNRQINDKKFIEQKLKECREWLAKTS